MTPDLDTDPLLLLAFAVVLWAVAYLVGRRERTAPIVVVLAQRGEHGAANDGVLNQHAQHDEQEGDDAGEQQHGGGVLRGEHSVSVPGGLLRFESPLTPDEAAEYQRRWIERRHG